MGKMNELSMLVDELKKVRGNACRSFGRVWLIYSAVRQKKAAYKKSAAKKEIRRGAKAGSTGGKGTHIGRC